MKAFILKIFFTLVISLFCVINIFAQCVITVNPKNASICIGTCITFTASGAVTYSWHPGNLSSASISVCPLATTTYTVIGTDANGDTCSAQAVVTVNPHPNVTVNSAAICSGECATLTAAGASAYSWSPATGLNTTTGAIVIACPFVTTTYTVTGTDSKGCKGSAHAVVTVHPLPNITLTIPAICKGASVSFCKSGCKFYVWNTGETIDCGSFTPVSTTTCTLSCTDVNGCQNSATGIITVYPLPEVTVNNDTICYGEVAVLKPKGASAYLWSTGDSYPEITVTPAVTTSYSVTGTDNNGCSDTAIAIVTVNTLPIIIISGNKTIYKGQSATLTVQGANTYLWNTGQITPTIIVKPSATTIYTVTGTDTNGCSDIASVTVKILPFKIPGTDNKPDFNKHMPIVNPNNAFNISPKPFPKNLSNPDAFEARIYPNPAESIVNISISASTQNEICLEITDIKGQKFFTKIIFFSSSHLETLDLSPFPKGIYYILFRNNNYCSVKKLVII